MVTIAKAMTGQDLVPRRVNYCEFQDDDGQSIDQGVALLFLGPASFTGEDVLELQGHGGPVVMDWLLSEVVKLGARIANPGEFSQRAFLNNKMDLAQAEAVADLIDSATLAAAKGALRSLKGEFSAKVSELAKALLELRMFTEAAIDFPEEEIDFLADTALQTKIDRLANELDHLLQQSRSGALLRDGLTLVFAGQPNAGKSSLMNRLVGAETSIVTEIPGTTRDIIKEQISLDGIPIKLVDTAGLRESDDAIEQEGVRRARKEIEMADGVLALIDLSAETPWQETLKQLLKGLPQTDNVLVALNKVDLLTDSRLEPGATSGATMISAKTGDGIEELKSKIKSQFAPGINTESPLISRTRHVDALRRCGEHINQGRDVLLQQAAGELFAEELKLAHQALCEITGEFTSDDLLGEIFSSFCIGK